MRARLLATLSLGVFACASSPPPSTADGAADDSRLDVVDAAVAPDAVDATDVAPTTDVADAPDVVDLEDAVDEGPRDEVAPVVTLLGPTTRWISTRRARLLGSVVDDSAVTLTATLDGESIALTSRAEKPDIDVVLDPPPGEHEVVLSATDAANNRGSAGVRVVVGAPLSAGVSHGVALRDGRALTWGGDGNGALGRGTDAGLPPGEAALGDAAVTSVAGVSSAGATLALDARGNVWSWGASTGSAPSVTATVDDAVQVWTGASHRLALSRAGVLRAWGANTAGQLGVSGSPTAPAVVRALDDVVSACAGSSHSAAVTADGSAWAWGANTSGQLGRGAIDTSPHVEPVAVEPITEAVAVACGREHTLALLSDGTVLAWGSGTSGQIGDGRGATAPLPTRVTGLSRVIAIVAGGNTSWAIDLDGQLWAWGQNGFGQLGVGTSAGRNAPSRVTALTGVLAVASGGVHTVFRTVDGRVWAAGSNTSGQLGRAGGASFVPVEVTLP